MKNALLLVCFGAIFLGATLAQAQDTDAKQTGPTTLVMQYRCAPGVRAKLRQEMVQSGLARFDELRSQGILASYRVLFSRYVDTNNWDMLVLLNFAHYSDLKAWKRIERNSPGGLNPETVSLVSAIGTYPVDSVRRSAASPAPAEPVFLVVPYTISVPAPEYLKYFDAYVKPQFEGWMQEAVLARYDVFMQRYTAARPWDSLIILEYKDDESFGVREKIVGKVREQLMKNPAWKAVSDSKHNVRAEKEAVIADEFMIRR